MKKIGTRSLKNIVGIDSRLALVLGMVLARGKVDFTVICGLRTTEEQQAEYKKGASQLDGINKVSWHQKGMAIDFIPYPFDNNWENHKQFSDVGEELKFCANHLGFKNQYGGDWGWDWGHFELN